MSTDWISRARGHDSARTERGARTEHEKARLVPLSASRSSPADPRTLGTLSRCSALGSVRFHGNNVRHWRAAVADRGRPSSPLSRSLAGHSALSPVLLFVRSVQPCRPLVFSPLRLHPQPRLSAAVDRPKLTTGRLTRRVRGCSFAARDCAPFFERPPPLFNSHPCGANADARKGCAARRGRRH